jgi:peroxiredoxin Q/BCP
MRTELEAGTPAPTFEAKTDSGETVSLADYRGQKVVLYFYPKDDTPGCTTQSCGFRDIHDEIAEKNAVVFGISPDGQESHEKFRVKFDLPFTLLVDEDHSISEAYGVWGERTMSGRTFMGIYRSHFVIDEKGELLEANYNVAPADSPSGALAALS